MTDDSTVPAGWRWVSVSPDDTAAAHRIYVRPAEVSAVEPAAAGGLKVVGGGADCRSRIHLTSRTTVLSPLNPSTVIARLEAALVDDDDAPIGAGFGRPMPTAVELVDGVRHDGSPL